MKSFEYPVYDRKFQNLGFVIATNPEEAIELAKKKFRQERAPMIVDPLTVMEPPAFRRNTH